MTTHEGATVDVRAMGFGIAGAVESAVIQQVAAAAEFAGFATFWLNDTPDGDAIAGLSAAAQATSTIRLATGVLPLDRQGALQIARRVKELGLPEERLTLGVGSGRAASALTLVEQGVRELKLRTNARIVVGALGPNMRALAARAADGVLLNWLTPAGAQQAMNDLRATAANAHQPPIHVALYVRASLGSEAAKRLEQDAARYEQFPSYAANFARLGVGAEATAVKAATQADLRRGMAAFVSTVDETVVRAITVADTVGDYQALIDAVVGR